MDPKLQNPQKHLVESMLSRENQQTMRKVSRQPDLMITVVTEGGGSCMDKDTLQVARYDLSSSKVKS